MNSLINTIQANAEFSLLSWEPVFGSGERLNVAAVFQYEGQLGFKTLIREDVLRCMYGEAGEGVYKMICTTINACTTVAKKYGMSAALTAVPLANFSLSTPRQTLVLNEQDLLRQIVLMNCSLGSIADEIASTSDDQPTSEQEVSKQWTTKIRDAIQVLQPDMLHYFNREAILVENGVPVRFGVLTPRLAAHFGLLKAGKQNEGMEDARAKMWKLALAKERNNSLIAALIYGTPKDDDITLSDKQQEKLVANVRELEQEAVQRGLTASRVYTVAEAAASVVSLA
jgi:hypothetical protein